MGDASGRDSVPGMTPRHYWLLTLTGSAGASTYPLQEVLKSQLRSSLTVGTSLDLAWFAGMAVLAAIMLLGATSCF